ncbi:cysteine desulfurase family protein [Actinotalea fermentans]|uniref:Aminotransferase n=1 Tax=Actinotalea fermentans TaxID=43671 RepID=A0A511YTZ8_9CELL|nr:aminotransferase class V-fold PLP-dependent enzyme [Actinotalea fermentans]GEN78669.1 aminotransferase [Actinotalea fermentans]
MERTYLDAGGRAPVHPAAREAYLAALDEGWADPGRLHAEGRRARLLLDAARESLAEALGARPQEVHLTPSHTASLHLAVTGAARARRRTGRRVVTSAIERGALLAAARAVDDEATTVPVDRSGRVDLEAWRAAVTPDVAVAALQHANGEVGTVQPIAEAHEAARRAGVPLLVDAGASIGHAPVEPAWDLLAADPPDWGAPAGVGVLAVRTRVRMSHGGPEDEDPWAPGGVSVPAALAAAAALRAVLADAREPDPRRALVDQIRQRVLDQVPDVDVAGDPAHRLPHVLTFSCLYVDGEALVTELDRRGFAVGSGSACTSSSLQPSHVLAAMGLLTQGNVRIALPREVDAGAVARFCDELPAAVAGVRAMVEATGR